MGVGLAVNEYRPSGSEPIVGCILAVFSAALTHGLAGWVISRSDPPAP